MLQQTTFATAENRFQAFMRTFPTLESLAAATQAEVLQHWAGLGYYARARNLHKCAQVLVTQYNGQFPEKISTLLQLPGIGQYTAAAIAAIAFNQPSVAVDSNVKRIFARICRFTQPVKDNSPELYDFFNASQANQSAREHLQAWMDFGETLCKPRQPDCANCPVQTLCQGTDIATSLPIKAVKKPRKQLHALAYFLTSKSGKIWLRRRPDTGLLAGMLEIPTSVWVENSPSHPKKLPAVNWQLTNQTVHHRFTHIDLYITILQATGNDKTNLSLYGTDSDWYNSTNLGQIGLATLMKKIVGAMDNYG